MSYQNGNGHPPYAREQKVSKPASTCLTMVLVVLGALVGGAIGVRVTWFLLSWIWGIG